MSVADAGSIARRSRRQLVAGLITIPLSLVPFIAYSTLTPEGRLVRDRLHVRLAPPTVPTLDAATRAELRASAPHYRDAVMPLVYHGLGAATDQGYAISPSRFGEHLAAMRAAGMNFVTARQVALAFAGKAELPPNAVMISFDDGREDSLLWATPLLHDAHAKATMFVITGAADSDSSYYGSWSDLARAPDGDRVWDLESHTAAEHVDQHTDQGDLPMLTSRAKGESLAAYRRRIAADLSTATAALTEHVHSAPVAFAYPFGAWGADRTNDRRIQSVLAAELAKQYQLAFMQDDQANIELATAQSDPLALQRLSIEDWTGPQLVRKIRAAAQRTEAARAGGG